MKEIQLSHKDNTHITTITEYDLKQLLRYAETYATGTFTRSTNHEIINTIKFLRMSLDL